MHPPNRLFRSIVLISAVAPGLLIWPGAVAVSPLEAATLSSLAPPGGVDCSDNSTVHWARTWSGSSSTVVGTRITGETPTTWSVESPYGTTLENAWIINASNVGDSVEAGYYSGYWAYGNHGWTNSLVSYIADSDGMGNAWNNINGLSWGVKQGLDIAVYQNTSLQPVAKFMNVTTGATGQFVDKLYSGGVTEPIQNYAQGEVHGNSTWMGGGSGELFSGWWTNDPTGTNWYLWGSNGGCSTNGGYFETGSGDNYSNGGYNAK